MSRGSLSYPEPALTDGRIGLRRWRENDLDCVRLAATDPDIASGTTVPAKWTPAAALAYVHRQWARAETGEGVSQAVVEAEGDRVVGMVWVGLRPQPHVGGLGYWVVPSARGRGVASTAVCLVVPWALEALALRRLEAWVDPANTPSQGVLRRAGFVEEGRLRRFLTVGDRTTDALVFSVVADDEHRDPTDPTDPIDPTDPTAEAR